MPLLRTIPFNTTPEYAAMLDDLDFMAPMRSRFAIPEYNGKNAIYFATHSNGLTPISAQYLQQHYYKKWNNFHVLQPDRWKEIVLEQYDILVSHVSRLLHIKSTHLAFDNDGQVLLNKLVDTHPNFNKCYTFLENIPEVFKQKYSIVNIKIDKSHIHTDGIVQYILNEVEANSFLYLPSISTTTGNAFHVDSIRDTAIKKNIIIIWDISLAINNMNVDLKSANILYAIFRTNAFMHGGANGIYGCYSKNGSFNHSNFPLLNAINLVASVDLLAKTSIKEIREKAKDLLTYFSLLLDDLGNNYTIVTNQETLNLSAYLVLHTKKPIYEQLIKNGFVVTAINDQYVAISFSALYNSYQDIYHFYLLLKEIQSNA